MGKVGASSKGPGTKELSELNFHVGVVREGQGVSKEDEFQVNEEQGVNDGRSDTDQGQVLTQSGQLMAEQHRRGPLVCWEEFLSVKSLKVLLVENDDSTRHLVSALLRNCGYEVIAVADGIQAWKLLKDLTTRVDLVLTEVIMPCLSGIDLLTKIMDHKTCRNIPVIMMSSYCMSTVLKCLSQGAVDFLVKPIRKNELKNLWQHVWRNCHSPRRSASESGIRTQKSSRSTSVEESDKNIGSNYEDNIGSIGLNVRDGGDKGSGSEITQVDNSRHEAFSSGGVTETKIKECEGQDREIDAVVMDKHLGTGVPRIPRLQLEEPNEEGLTNMAGINKYKLAERYSMKDGEQLERGQSELNNENSNRKLRNKALDLMSGITNCNTDPKMQGVMFDMPNGVSKDINYDDIHNSKEIPSLNLSLKTKRDVRDSEFNDHDQNVLRHSDHYSAFSRYKSPPNSKQDSSGNVGSYSPLDYGSSAAKSKSLQVFQSNSNSSPPYQRSTGGIINNDTDSTTNNFFTNKVACEDNVEAKSTIKSLNPSSVFNPDHNRVISLSQPVIQGKCDTAVRNTSLSEGRGMSQQVQLQHHYYHMLDVSQQRLQHHRQQPVPNHDGLSPKNLAAEATQYGSSNLQAAPMEGNVGDYCLHGSASGSNRSSNGQSQGNSAINSRGTNMGSDKEVVGEGVIGAVDGGSKSEVNQNHISQREAALNKFRQKRKDRCFEKKVRYQSRKKMAEQRPRVRGQFVRQVVHESKGYDTHS